MPGENFQEKVEALSFTPLKREICRRAGLEADFDEFSSFGAFLKSIVLARNIKEKDLAEKAQVDPTFIVRLCNDYRIPRTRVGRELGDERYGRLADALGLDRGLFLELVVCEQKRGRDMSRELTTEADGLIREHRIKLTRMFKLEPSEDPHEEARREESIEKLLKDFAKKVVKAMARR